MNEDDRIKLGWYAVLSLILGFALAGGLLWLVYAVTR